MPVLVVGAGTPFGRALCDALLATGGQVRAYVNEPEAAEPLRARGVHCAIGGPLDVERLESACAQVHTVIHLTGRRAGRDPRDEAEAVEVTSIAAHAADVVRVIVATEARGRAAAIARSAMQTHGMDRGFELIECPLPADDDEAVATLLAADARI